MKSQYLPSLLALVATTVAQTPSGFTPSIDTNLGVTYGNITVSPPGEQLQRSAVANRPNISQSPSLFSQTGKAVVIMIDLDVARNGIRIPNLHWIAPDITGSISGTNTTQLTLAAADVENGVQYRQPSPPVGDYAHRYIYLLYEQPSTFPSSLGNLTNNRIGFNLTNFAAQNGLTTPLAANYILVANNSGPATTSYPPASFSVSSTISVSSPTGSATTTGVGSSATSGGSATSSGAGASGTASSAVGIERGSAFALLVAAVGLFVRL